MTKFIRAVFAVFLLALLTACGGGGGSAGNTSGTSLFTTAAEKIVISPGETQTYNIGGGVPSYTATSNSGAAGVNVNGKTLTITGGGGGTATITVKDATGAKVLIDVTVGSGLALYTTAPSAVTVGVGSSSTIYFIGGGSQLYAVSSSNQQVATVGVNGSIFIINGVAGGKATVIVKDSLGASVSIDVVVGTSDAMFSTAAADIAMEVGAANIYKVGGGTTQYSASSSNPGVAKATMTGTDLTITGVATGKAVVVVRDTAVGSVTINVTVGNGTVTPLFTTAAADIVVAPSTSPTFTIGGGKAPYNASSSNATVVTASVSANTLTVKGLVAGSAKVIVSDSAGVLVPINVTVGTGAAVPLFTTAPSAVTVSTGVTVPYTVGGGTAPYTVSSSNTSVATVSQSGTSFSITGVSAGAAQVAIVDAAGKTVNIAVTVSPVATIALDVLPNGATGSVGDVLTFKVSGGSPSYSVTINNPSIATVSPTTVAAGGSFTATLLNAGSTVITVIDAQGAVKTLNLTVTQNAALLRLSPSALTVGENNASSINLSIYGGTGPYTAFTSDLKKSSVSVAGNIMTVAVGTAGNRCIDPVDGSGAYVRGGTYDVTLTVVDSLGASAVSTMTIKDNSAGLGAGCP